MRLVIWISLYLDMFSFKLHAALLDNLENYILGAPKHNKYNLHAFQIYFNFIVIEIEKVTSIPSHCSVAHEKNLKTHICHKIYDCSC